MHHISCVVGHYTFSCLGVLTLLKVGRDCGGEGGDVLTVNPGGTLFTGKSNTWWEYSIAGFDGKAPETSYMI